MVCNLDLHVIAVNALATREKCKDGTFDARRTSFAESDDSGTSECTSTTCSPHPTPTTTTSRSVKRTRPKSLDLSSSKHQSAHMAMSSRQDVKVKKILGRSASVVQHITWKENDYAAKVSPPDSAVFAIREFLVLDQLSEHPNIPKVMCIERCESTECILILEFLAGHDVKKLMDDGLQLDADLARCIATQLLSAAAHAHSCGVAHRDISLDNLILDVESKRTVLIDWNMAITDFKDFERPKKGVTVTQHGHSMGFCGYAEGAYTAKAQDNGRRGSVDSPLFTEPVDLYGKYDYRAPLGCEGNWLQQDAYACGVILAKLGQAAPSFQCPVVKAVTAGLLAPPDARMSLAQAAAALVDLEAP